MATLVAHAQNSNKDYSIMAPEPGTKAPAKAKHRRGSSNPVYPTPLPPPLHYVPPESSATVTQPAPVPPALISPKTGQALPNLPTVAPSGPRGTESYQDRAVRCAHQAGVYGQAAGDRAGYIGSCINQ
jgi:hypothetical protein